MKSFIKRSFSIMLVLCFMFVSFGLFGKTKVNAIGEKPFGLYSGAITEGDYIIYFGGKAMNTTVTSKRLQYEEVTPSANVISTSETSIVWHIAPAATDGYWTIYNAVENKYAASNGTKNQAQMLEDGTDDQALWTVSGTSTYEFVNKKNKDSSVNANLRNNGTYGFACYGTGTGEALSLYKVQKIQFDGNGSTGGSAPSTIYVAYNKTSSAIPACSYTRTGYTFTGWNTAADGSGTPYDPADTISSFTADITLYAQWALGATTYTVTFNSDGGSSVASITDIEPASKISKPSDPTKAGNTFLGWFYLGTKWDFANNVVASDITLTAHWLDNAVLTDLNDIESYMSLGYKYATSATDTLDREFTTIEDKGGYASWSDKTLVSGAKYAGRSAGDKNSIQLRSNDSLSGIIQTVSGGLVSKVTISWNSDTASGRTLNVYGKNTAYEATTDLYDDEKYGTLLGTIVKGTSTELEITGDYKYIGLRSDDGAMYINSIDIDYNKGYTSVDFRLKCGVDDIIELVGYGLGGEVGIAVTANGKTVKKAYDDALIHDDTTNDIKYLVVSLGDLLNNLSRFDIDFTVRAYFTIDGETFYSTSIKTYSVLDMIEEYNTSGTTEVKTAIAGLVDILTDLGKIS